MPHTWHLCAHLSYIQALKWLHLMSHKKTHMQSEDFSKVNICKDSCLCWQSVDYQFASLGSNHTQLSCSTPTSLNFWIMPSCSQMVVTQKCCICISWLCCTHTLLHVHVQPYRAQAHVSQPCQRPGVVFKSCLSTSSSWTEQTLWVSCAWPQYRLRRVSGPRVITCPLTLPLSGILLSISTMLFNYILVHTQTR